MVYECDDENFVPTIVNLYRENRWRDILEINKESDNLEARKLLWVWPNEDNLRFIKEIIEKFNLKGITSIGCGCGLLEWIIKQSTGLSVIGYEVNEEWWKSRYANPKFIELYYPEWPLKEKLDSNFALLFCYFNDGQAFIEYIQSYEGNVIFIIGPKHGAGRHTNPQPFEPDFGDQQQLWHLYDYQQVKDTFDYIAVYIRNYNEPN